MSMCPHCDEVDDKHGKCPHCGRSCDGCAVSSEQFMGALKSILNAATGDDLLSIPGVYELVAEHYNDDVLQDIENDFNEDYEPGEVYDDPCQQCLGVGEVDEMPCPVCHGAEYVETGCT